MWFKASAREANRVYVTGASSSAMMANGLLIRTPTDTPQFGFRMRRPTGNVQVPGAYNCTPP